MVQWLHYNLGSFIKSAMSILFFLCSFQLFYYFRTLKFCMLLVKIRETEFGGEAKKKF